MVHTAVSTDYLYNISCIAQYMKITIKQAVFTVYGNLKAYHSQKSNLRNIISRLSCQLAITLWVFDEEKQHTERFPW